MHLKLTPKRLILFFLVGISGIIGIIGIFLLIIFARAVSPASYSHEWHNKVSQIEKLEQQGRIDEAYIETQHLMVIAKSDAEKAHGLITVARVNIERGDNKAAIKNYEDSLSIFPKQMGVQEALMPLYYQEKDYVKANKVAVDLAENGNPPSAAHYYAAGISFQYLNNKEMADYYFKKAAEFK